MVSINIIIIFIHYCIIYKTKGKLKVNSTYLLYGFYEIDQWERGFRHKVQLTGQSRRCLWDAPCLVEYAIRVGRCSLLTRRVEPLRARVILKIK